MGDLFEKLFEAIAKEATDVQIEKMHVFLLVLAILAFLISIKIFS